LGCFSPQADQDLKIMSKYGLVEVLETGWVLKSDIDYTSTLKREVQKDLNYKKVEYN
jgi:hypothetical protein